MPIYEYLCNKCNERFSLLQKVNASANETRCPKCASEQVKKLMSSFCCSASESGFASSSPSRGGHGGG